MRSCGRLHTTVYVYRSCLFVPLSPSVSRGSKGVLFAKQISSPIPSHPNSGVILIDLFVKVGFPPIVDRCMSVYVGVCRCMSSYVVVCRRMSLYVVVCRCMSLYIKGFRKTLFLNC